MGAGAGDAGRRRDRRLLFAVLAGGLILNVLKEELPDERSSNVPAFVAGAGSYALVALFTGS